jgi:hypothetical protein
MTEQQQSPGPDQAEAYVTEYRRLWDATVATLTAAVRVNHPQHGAVDFADFLASALGAVAGNVGSGERITAGRPGSWESDLVAQLVTGTVGDDGAALATYRTEPVVVRLNVAQLVIEAREDAREQERDGMLVDLADAIDALPDPWGDGREPTEEEESDWAAAEAHLRRRYTEAYEAYAQRFAAAVAEAAEGIEGLSVPVEVKAETDPEASWGHDQETTNPQEWAEDDELACRLWAAARQRAGVPRLDDTARPE